jgi:hypothetical protein
MIVIAYKPGQLANQLFLFAKFIAYSYRHHCRVLNPAFHDYAHYFDATAHQRIPSSAGKNGSANRALARLFYTIMSYAGRIGHRMKLNKGFFSVLYLDWKDHFDLDHDSTLKRAGLHLIRGWEFGAEDLLRSYKEQIRTFFRPEEKLQAAIDHFAVDRSGILMGVHIRHGDYRSFEGGKYYFETKQYAVWMKSLKQRYPTVHFLVCTNNRELTQTNFDGLDVTFAPGHELIDLYLLSTCDYIMGPPSTYSLWASYYGSVPLYQIKSASHEPDWSDFQVVR